MKASFPGLLSVVNLYKVFYGFIDGAFSKAPFFLS
jgi:hypothetical protein